MTKLKKILPYLINTLLIIGIILIAFKMKGIYPFKTFDYTISDAEEQYKPMLYQFIMSLKTNTLTNYNFLNGLGNPTIFNFLYYLASPLNLVALFFNTPNSMYLSVTLLKIGLTSITTTYYLKKKLNKNTVVTLGTLSYVFCGWFLAYYFNHIWLDAFLIFPLFQLGLEKIIYKKKCLLYIFTLAYLYMTNFYMAFLVSVYTIFYFIFYLIKEKRTKKESLYSFELIFLSTCISFLLISFYLYAIFDSFLKMGININTGETNNYIVTFFDFIKSFIYGTTNRMTYIKGNTFPNIGVNSLLLINTIYFFINKKIERKEKITSLIALLIISLAFFFPPFDHLINGFHQTLGFPFRYTFIISFYMLNLLIKNYQTFEGKIDKKIYIILGIILIVLLLEYKNLKQSLFFLNLISLLGIAFYFLAYKKSKPKSVLLILLISVESLLAFTISLEPITTNDKYSIKDFQTENTNYRKTSTEEELKKSVNYNLYTNTKTTNIFTSMGYNQIISLTSALGCPTNGINRTLCSYKTEEDTKMLLNIEGTYTLEKIFAVNKDLTLLDYDQVNPAITKSNIIETMTGITGLYDKIELSPTKEDETYYYYELDAPKVYTFEVEYDNQLETYTQEFQTLSIEKKMATDDKIILYELNEEKLKSAYAFLKKNQIHYTHYEDNHLEGKIEVEQNQIIFTSIPYDKDWKILVDGKETEPIRLLNSLLGIEVSEGTHTISLKYQSNYLPSILLSLGTFLSILIYSIKKRYSKRTK